MRKLFKLIKRCQRDMEDISTNISSIETLPYYKIFGSKGEQERDLDTCHKAMKMTLKEYDAILENLQSEIIKERQRISTAQRKYNLITN